MKKIIINESKRDVLLSAILNESLLGGDQSDKVLLVKDFLDKNFSKASSNNGLFDENGNRKTDSFVALLDNSKNVLKLLTDRQTFDILQEKFKTILPNQTDDDKKQRDKFLKKVLIAWYNDKITKQGSIME